ncbi:methyltransferase, FxLD system [Polymorphospora rubra]|uniref:methyltransferase, FxLD system n=1 Tax=Polymorphospora rubra TaxID=338584 RepID=UPI0033C6B7B8
MVDQLVAAGSIRSAAVERAFRVVPRHAFAPGVPLSQAYAQDIVVVKRDDYGRTISSVSAPGIQAMQLEQAGIKPGERCLEIGSGGYNAALMAEVTGGEGSVTTIDIDPDVINRARTFLTEAGYAGVEAACVDGEDGYAPNAPYDKIIVTVGSWDVPPAWTDQLAPGGTITVPLRMRGHTRSLVLCRDGDRLVSESAQVCGFVSMQGLGEHAERLLKLHGDMIGLRFDDGGVPSDPSVLDGVLDTPRAEVWSGVVVGRMEPFDTLQLWLARLDGYCLMSVDRRLDTGVVSPQNKMACPTLLDAGSLAYLAIRRLGDAEVEFGAHGYGPDGPAIAETLVEELRAWDKDHRGGPGPRIAVYPITTPDAELPPGLVIDKRHRRIVVSWP